MDLYRIFTLLYVLMVECFIAQSVESSTIEESHYGTGFYLSFIRHYVSNKTLHIISDTEGILRIFAPSRLDSFEERRLSSGYTQFNLSAKGLSNYPLPNEQTGIYVITSVPVAIIVSDVDHRQSSDTFLALPMTLAGTSFMIASYRGYVSKPSFKYSGMEIVAISSNTTITIEYPENTTDIVTANELERQSQYRHEDLTGTIIISNKPVSVISGTYFAVIPTSGTATMIVEQMFPFQTWTNLYIVPPMPPMTQYIVRILSMEDQTVCFMNKTGSRCLQIKRSSNENYFFGSDPVLVQSEAPISVVQYGIALSSPDSFSGGFMINIPGIENYLNIYKFAIPEIRHDTKHFLAFIIPSQEIDGIIIDDESMSFDNEFSVANSSGNYNVLIKETKVGYHEVKHSNSNVRFGALAYGIDYRHSYGMPLGFTFFRTGESSMAWSEWSECSVTCGGATGVQTRTRSCENSQQGTGDDSCYTDTRLCNTGKCPVGGGFGVWSTGSSCSLTCGEGTQSRIRPCHNLVSQHGGQNCTRPNIDGGFSEWSIWSTCTVTCGGGSMSRVRSCDNPTPKHGGKGCAGTRNESTACRTQECQVDGNYSTWSDWSTCSLTCGSGFRARERFCNNPTPAHGGTDCIGEDTEVQPCNTNVCPVIPYGGECNLGRDKCDGENIECSGEKCRCVTNHYHDGDKCISETSIYTTTDKTTIIVGSVAGGIILILAAFAIFITVLYRRKAAKELTSNESVRPSNSAYANMETSEGNVLSMVVVKENTDRESRVNESQYTSLDGELRDTSSQYDFIKVN